MKFSHIMLIVGIMMVMDFIVVGALLHASVQALFEPLSKKFPPKEMKEGVIEKSFQSLKVGIMNYGLSVHLGVDDEHVHVVPALIFRWCGAKPSSVPISEVSTHKQLEGLRDSKLVEGNVGGIQMSAPAWLFRAVASTCISS